MIEINFIPLSQRKRKRAVSGGFNIPLEIVVGAGGGLLMLLVATHIVFLFINIAKFSHHKMLEKQWAQILPAKQNVDSVVSQLKALREKSTALENLTAKHNISWAQKLNILSDSLPRGVWLKKLALNENAFFIEGSAISRQKNEMINVHSLAANLKADEQFLVGLKEIELGSIQSRNIQTVEVADFLITAELK